MEHNKSQDISSMVGDDGSCPQKTLPDPAWYSTWHKVGHRAGQVTHPIPDTPRRVTAVNVENIRKTIFTLPAYRIIIRKKTMQSKVTSLIE